MPELVPLVCVQNAVVALDWYCAVLGATLVDEAITLPDGRIAHVELAIEGARFVLTDDFAGGGVAAAVPGRDTQIALHLSVPDVDAVIAEVTASGVLLDCGPCELAPVGRMASFHDPFGHRWLVGQARGEAQD